MLRYPAALIKAKSTHRSGILYLGALREVFVISFAVGLVMFGLWHVTSFMKVHSSSDTQPLRSKLLPVLGLTIDYDRNSVLAHIWGGDLAEISLESGELVQQTGAPEIIAAVASERNSTTARLSEWVDSGSMQHRVDIIRNGSIVVSEDFVFDTQTTATTHVSPDGNTAVMITLDGLAIAWNLCESNLDRWSFRVGSVNLENSLSFDGRRLFISTDQTTPFICNTRTGEDRVELEGFEGFCTCSAWARNGRFLAVGNQHGELSVYDTDSGKRVWQQRLGFLFARSVAFSHDGCSLAAGGFDHTIRIWNLTDTEQPVVELIGQHGIIRGLAFGPASDTLISASYEGTIHEWSLANQQTLRTLR